MEVESKTKVDSYLTFRIGDEEFGAHVSKVLNILEMPKITDVPQTPEYMIGVTNLRGIVLPVVDTRIKFGMTPTTITSNTCVLVLELDVAKERIMVGAMVDAVEEVLGVEEQEIKPSPKIGDGYNTEFIQGMVHQNESFIMILNMDKVFDVDEVISLKEANVKGTEIEE